MRRWQGKSHNDFSRSLVEKIVVWLSRNSFCKVWTQEVLKPQSCRIMQFKCRRRELQHTFWISAWCLGKPQTASSMLGNNSQLLCQLQYRPMFVHQTLKNKKWQAREERVFWRYFLVTEVRSEFWVRSKVRGVWWNVHELPIFGLHAGRFECHNIKIRGGSNHNQPQEKNVFETIRCPAHLTFISGVGEEDRAQALDVFIFLSPKCHMCTRAIPGVTVLGNPCTVRRYMPT